ncbi:GATA-type zinc finger transcription factor, partial [Phycomyces blakesleeanus NRRL 1555(-)]
CANCGTTTTPLWRRAPNGDTICNACGLYLKARNTLRPPTMKRSLVRKDGSGTTFNQQQVNKQTLMCANCRTTTTPLWRRDEAGNTICNACGLYYKLHNVHRPVSMKRSVIKRRKR